MALHRIDPALWPTHRKIIRAVNEVLDKTSYSAELSVYFIIDINNTTNLKSPYTEAVHFEIGESWIISQDGAVLPSTPAEKKKKLKYFIKAPVARLLSGGWAQLCLPCDQAL
jgi:hypothetical protein